MKTVYIVGGDKRSFYMAISLKKSGIRVFAYDIPGLLDGNKYGIEIIHYMTQIYSMASQENEKPALILPIPVTKDGVHIFGNSEMLELKQLSKQLDCFKFVCGGVIPQMLKTACMNEGVELYDFMQDDTVARKNAVATAEGAILEAFTLSDVNVSGSKSLVTGFGRCARVLAEKLYALQSDVTILARSDEACKEAAALGYRAIRLGHMEQDIALYSCQACVKGSGEPFLSEFDYCYNTVPAFILDQQILSRFSPDIVIIDIASKPGGTDFAYCEAHGIRYLHSLGIPGRYSPKTSGEILAEAFLLKGF